MRFLFSVLTILAILACAPGPAGCALIRPAEGSAAQTPSQRYRSAVLAFNLANNSMARLVNLGVVDLGVAEEYDAVHDVIYELLVVAEHELDRGGDPAPWLDRIELYLEALERLATEAQNARGHNGGDPDSDGAVEIGVGGRPADRVGQGGREGSDHFRDRSPDGFQGRLVGRVEAGPRWPAEAIVGSP